MFSRVFCFKINLAVLGNAVTFFSDKSSTSQQLVSSSQDERSVSKEYNYNDKEGKLRINRSAVKSMIESAVSSRFGPPIKVKVFHHGKMLANSASKKHAKRSNKRKNIGKTLSPKKVGLSLSLRKQRHENQPNVVLLVDKESSSGGTSLPVDASSEVLLDFDDVEIQLTAEAKKHLSHSQVQSIRDMLKTLQSQGSVDQHSEFRLHEDVGRESLTEGKMYSIYVFVCRHVSRKIGFSFFA